jgi:acyl-CoA synthetase (NDP forming)
MIATAGAEQYRRAIGTMAAWEGIDALIAIFIRPLLTRAEDVADAVRDALAELPREIPVLAVFMSNRDRAAMAATEGAPVYLYPEDAARALGRVMRHVEWRAGPQDEPAQVAGARTDEAAGLLAQALEQGRDWLGTEQIASLLDCYGIAMPAWRLAADPEEAGRVAEELGGEVALKAEGEGIVHKTELGAVRVGLSGAAEVAGEAKAIDGRLSEAGVGRRGFVVQEMAGEGTELLVGVVSDPVFGPVLACGAGGTQAELLGDVGVRICPITGAEAAETIRSLATFPLLTGFRGGPAADLGALEDLLLRVSAMVDAHHEIAELDLNPVIATADGAVAVDARVRVSTAPPPRPWPRTWR